MQAQRGTEAHTRTHCYQSVRETCDRVGVCRPPYLPPKLLVRLLCDVTTRRIKENKKTRRHGGGWGLVCLTVHLVFFLFQSCNCTLYCTTTKVFVVLEGRGGVISLSLSMSLSASLLSCSAAPETNTRFRGLISCVVCLSRCSWLGLNEEEL